jgi:hypothetical protein
VDVDAWEEAFRERMKVLSAASDAFEVKKEAEKKEQKSRVCYHILLFNGFVVTYSMKDAEIQGPGAEK